MNTYKVLNQERKSAKTQVKNMIYNSAILFLTYLFVCEVTLSQDTDCYHGSSDSYNGTLNKTVSGRTCQRWDSQTPHRNWYDSVVHFPADGSLYNAHNYCRDTESEGYFWCYTTDPDVRWEECDITKCPTTNMPPAKVTTADHQSNVLNNTWVTQLSSTEAYVTPGALDSTATMVTPDTSINSTSDVMSSTRDSVTPLNTTENTFVETTNFIYEESTTQGASVIAASLNLILFQHYIYFISFN